MKRGEINRASKRPRCIGHIDGHVGINVGLHSWGCCTTYMGYHVNIVCSQVLSCACRLLPLPLHQPSHSHRQQRQLPHNPCPPSLPHHYSFLRLPSEPQRLHFWRTIKLHACAQSLFSACCTCLLYQIPLAGCPLGGLSLRCLANTNTNTGGNECNNLW